MWCENEEVIVMVRLTESLKQFLSKFHIEILPLIVLGHTELFDDEMQEEYVKWCQTDEGRQYLKGGAKYKDPD